MNLCLIREIHGQICNFSITHPLDPVRLNNRQECLCYVGSSEFPQDGVLAEALFGVWVIQRIVEAAGFLASDGALDDEAGDSDQVAEFKDVRIDAVAPVELPHFFFQIPQARGDPAEAVVGAGWL